MKNPVKKPSWWDEFAAFAIKGNAMALAVGTIIGAAFSTITKSLTDDIIMPIVSIFLGGVDFSEMKLVLPRLFGEPVVDDAGNRDSQYPELRQLHLRRDQFSDSGAGGVFPGEEPEQADGSWAKRRKRPPPPSRPSPAMRSCCSPKSATC